MLQTGYKQIPMVESDRCRACGLCVSVCPHGSLDLSGETATLVREDLCTGEGLCASVCPVRAIRMESTGTSRKRRPAAALRA